jgi:hypothetical protein
MSADELTVREARFVELVSVPGTLPTIAAREAGYAFPAVDACRAQARPDVQAAIAERKAQLAESFDAIAARCTALIPGKLPDTRADDLSKIASRSVTTAALLRGEATAITANTTVSGNVELQAKASDLAALFGVDPARVLADLTGD